MVFQRDLELVLGAVGDAGEEQYPESKEVEETQVEDFQLVGAVLGEGEIEEGVRRRGTAALPVGDAAIVGPGEETAIARVAQDEEGVEAA